MRRNDPVPTRDRILDAAQRLFEAQGYNATGVAEILRESGANSGSLYHFFGSKEDLLVAVLRRHVERLDQDVLGPAAGQSEDAVERVLALFDGYRRSLRASDFRSGCPVGDLALEVADVSPAAQEQVAKYFDDWCDGVRGWLEASGNCLPPNTDPARTARLLLTVVQGALMQGRALRSVAPFDECVDQLRVLLQWRSSGGRRTKRRRRR